MMRTSLISVLCMLFCIVLAGQTKKVLFIGNSYTYFNNMPSITADIAESMGDSIVHDQSTPGGFTFQGHSTNATTNSLIEEGDWDFVILQEQSQRPSFPIFQVEQDVFPYATTLDEKINEFNTCAETVFYMTWGRKNGDSGNCPVWPPVCTYEGMDSLLNLRYKMMADMNDAIVSPVGAVWRYIRENYPDIELYNPDESHPSQKGSYAAALTHYTSMFRKDPTLVPYNYNLSEAEASQIREACKIVLFDALSDWNIGQFDLSASFDVELLQGTTYQFTNTSQNADSVSWNFLGVPNAENDPIITFSGPGDYSIHLEVFNACDTITIQEEFFYFSPGPVGIEDLQIKEVNLFPNPSSDRIYIESEKQFTSYIVYDNLGRPIIAGNLDGNPFIDISELKGACYNLQLISDNAINFMRFYCAELIPFKLLKYSFQKKNNKLHLRLGKHCRNSRSSKCGKIHPL